MNRRRALGGAVAATAIMHTQLAGAGTAAQLISKGRVVTAPACAMFPISVGRQLNGPTMQIRIERCWSAESSLAPLARWDFDLSVIDDSGVARIVHAWQLRRSGSGQMAAASGLRMRFPANSPVAVLSQTVRHSASGDASTLGWAATLPTNSLMVITTTRASSGQVPKLAELRFDPISRALSLADGSTRDFDALLLQTS